MEMEMKRSVCIVTHRLNWASYLQKYAACAFKQVCDFEFIDERLG